MSIRFWALAVLLGGCVTPTDPRVKDPCYSATVWVDTTHAVVDSITYAWTPGVCDEGEG